MNRNLKHLCFSGQDSIEKVVLGINRNRPHETHLPSGIALIIGKTGKLEGIVTDGDIRRGIAKGIDLNSSVSLIVNPHPFTVVGDSSNPTSMLSSITDSIKERGWEKGYVEKVVVVSPEGRPLDVVSTYHLWQSSDVRFKRIGIIGLGYVGLTLALSLADRGFEVRGYDLNNRIRRSLARGIPHFYERGLQKMLSDNLGKRFQLVRNFKKSNSCDVYIVAVGTPVKKSAPNISNLKDAAHLIGRCIKRGDAIILRSTVPVGTTRSVIVPMVAKVSGLKAGEDFLVSFAPERTVEGRALEELKILPQVIGGFNHASSELTSSIFSFLTKSTIILESLEAAELVKLANNTFRDISFAFANELSMVSRKWGVNTNRLIKAANEGYDRNKIPRPSPGVGGTCLTKDPHIYAHSAKEVGVKSMFPSVSRMTSDLMIDSIVKEIIDFIKNNNYHVSSPRVLIMGFAYKGKPETSDTRDSTTYGLVERLRKIGIRKIFGYDPIVNRSDITKAGVQYVFNVKKEIRGSDIIVAMNDNEIYSNLDLRGLLEGKVTPTFILDGWGLFSTDELSKLPGVTISQL